jgi:hypothetical protein
VGAGVVKILPLYKYSGTTTMPGKVISKGKRSRTTGIRGHNICIFPPKIGVVFNLIKLFDKLVKGGDKYLREIGTSEFSIISPVNHLEFLLWSVKTQTGLFDR